MQIARACRPAGWVAAGARPAPGRAAQAGFTLLEVLVVLVILGLLAAVVAGPQIFKYLGTAKSEAAKVQVQQISSALDLYRLEVGRYPTAGREPRRADRGAGRGQQVERPVPEEEGSDRRSLGPRVPVQHPRPAR